MPMSQATADGRLQWLTDEFESEDYIAGNLEKLWDMYLFDMEGKPMLMPGEEDKLEGETKQQLTALQNKLPDYKDYHSAWRPRGIDTEDMRDALWVTDEFESEEDATESEWRPEYVGAGIGLKDEDPLNPQWSLRHSNHPLAPFPGEALRWSSYVWADGTTYEGLTREGIAHGMGVMIMGNGTGGGFNMKHIRRGDKYEGEFQAGYAHGLGQFTSVAQGEVFIGEFFAGQRHGCGLHVNMRPFYFLMERGMEPGEAYVKTFQDVMSSVTLGTWFRDQVLGDAHEDEVVMHRFVEEYSNPFTVLARNRRHDMKLREWQQMSSEQKAHRKLLEIIAQTKDDWLPKTGYYKDARGKVHVRPLDPQDADTDSAVEVDMMLGNTTDGNHGFGWNDDSGDSELFPPDLGMVEEARNKALKAKAEAHTTREQVMGENIVNPITGLNLYDYLENNEWDHNEILRLYDPKNYPGDDPDEGRVATEELFPYEYPQDNPARYDWTTPDLEAERSQKRELQALLSDLPKSAWREFDAWQKMERETEKFMEVRGTQPGKHPFEVDTDTRFETEEEFMPLADLPEILGTVQEALGVVTRARMWRWKPEGEVTLRFAQDGAGQPVPLMQDPLHYPWGTKFMAPGPLGQCHPIPPDPEVINQMRRVAHNYEVVHSQYNFDYDPQPGSVQWTIDQRIRRAQELMLRHAARKRAAAQELLDLMSAPDPAEGGARTAAGAQELAAVAEALQVMDPSEAELRQEWHGIQQELDAQVAAAQEQRWVAEQGPTRVPLPATGSSPFSSISMSVRLSPAARVLVKTLTGAWGARSQPARRVPAPRHQHRRSQW